MESTTYTFPIIGYRDVVFASSSEVISASLVIDNKEVSKVQRGFGIEKLDSARVHLDFLGCPLRAGLLRDVRVVIECPVGEIPSLEIGEVTCEPLTCGGESVTVKTDLGPQEYFIEYFF